MPWWPLGARSGARSIALHHYQTAGFLIILIISNKLPRWLGMGSRHATLVHIYPDAVSQSDPKKSKGSLSGDPFDFSVKRRFPTSVRRRW